MQLFQLMALPRTQRLVIVRADGNRTYGLLGGTGREGFWHVNFPDDTGGTYPAGEIEIAADTERLIMGALI